MRKITLKKGDTVPTLDGYIKIFSNNGSGLFYGDRYSYGDEDPVLIMEDAAYTANDLASYHNEATGEVVIYHSYLDDDDNDEYD